MKKETKKKKTKTIEKKYKKVIRSEKGRKGWKVSLDNFRYYRRQKYTDLIYHKLCFNLIR